MYLQKLSETDLYNDRAWVNDDSLLIPVLENDSFIYGNIMFFFSLCTQYLIILIALDFDQLEISQQSEQDVAEKTELEKAKGIYVNIFAVNT